MKRIAPFLSAGGRLAFVALESIFSRTRVECSLQTVNETARQAALFAQGWAQGLDAAGQGEPPEFFLYDTPAHMTVGTWPPNVPKYELDLGNILQLLLGAFRADPPLRLTGFWMDLPYEYSRDYPNATQPFPAGSGFERVAAAVELARSLGLKVHLIPNCMAPNRHSGGFINIPFH